MIHFIIFSMCMISIACTGIVYVIHIISGLDITIKTD